MTQIRNTSRLIVLNALEELYKFLNKYYEIVQSEKYRSLSLKCSYLLNNTDELILPKHFDHLSENYIIIYTYILA